MGAKNAVDVIRQAMPIMAAMVDMAKQPDYDDWDLFYLGMAKYVSKKSKDPSTQVGAVIVRPDRTLASIGFNGFPQGMNDDPALYANREEKLSRVIHAEINAREFAKESVKGYTIYVWPFMPCDRCAGQMIQAGIARFVFPEATEDQKSRWQSAFDKTISRIDEMNRGRTEVPLSVAEGL